MDSTFEQQTPTTPQHVIRISDSPAAVVNENGGLKSNVINNFDNGNVVKSLMNTE